MRPQLRAPAAPALLTAIFAVMLAALLTGLPANLMPPTAIAAGCTGSAVRGTAFRDYNANGTQDSREPGIGGIVVTATGTGGGSVSCTTTADGSYGINPPAGPAGAFPVRVEFTLPPDGSLAFLAPGPAGTGSRTTVTFVAGPTGGVNVGFQNANEYCGPDAGVSAVPDLVATCPAYGENNNPDGLFKTAPVLYRFPYNAGGTNLGSGAVIIPTPSVAARAQQIGTTAGLAWNPGTQTLYAAAFLKRHAGFGPGGPGAIYQVTSAGPSLFHNFGALAGVDPHPQPGQTCQSPKHNEVSTNSNCWLHDPNTFDAVGKGGFGDLALGPMPGSAPSGSLTTLYAVNLADNTLLAIPLANPAAYTAAAIPVPTTCAAADYRPFGLGINDGVLYVGAVCSAESTQKTDSLQAYVLAYPFAAAAFNPTPVLKFPLTYDRGSNNPQWNRQWRYWLNRTTFDPDNSEQSNGRWAQPWLTDITFDRGDMILALRDRNGDLFGIAGSGPDFYDSQNYTAVAQGDLLRACANAAGGWDLENNGFCGGVKTAGHDNGQGPGGGEYYYQDYQDRQSQSPREETSWGSAVQLAGRADVAVTAYGPLETNTANNDGGIKWYTNATAVAARSYRVFDGTGEPIRFDSANGLGGLVALCPAEPLEIGNRIWLDANGDGVQDPGEGGIGGVAVNLYREGSLVGTTTTAADGTYLFNAAKVNLNGAAGIVPGLCGAGGAPVYTVRVPNTDGGSRQAPLAGLLLSDAQQDPTAGGSMRDSDGQPIGNDAVAPIACASLAAPGADDHTVDFGFHPPVPPIARSQVVTTAEDTPLLITLTGRDPDGQPITFITITTPTHGTLAGIPPFVTYAPDRDFNGQDGFSFKVNDGSFDSAPAPITITVTPVNDPPVVPSQDPRGAQIVTTEEDTPVGFVVAAYDVDGDPLTYHVVTPPAHGTLSGALPAAVYLPAPNYNGPDSFVFGVSDGFAEVTGTVQIEVAPVDDPPVAADLVLTTDVKTAITITLAAVDVEGEPLTYHVVTGPQHGILTGTPPQVVYSYVAGGSLVDRDQFTFVANDGRANSNVATVIINLKAAPVGLDVVPEPAILDPRVFLPAINLDR